MSGDRRGAVSGSPQRPKPSRAKLLNYLFLAPALALSIVFFVVPLVILIVMSFYRWPLFGTIRFNGVENYIKAFQDAAFGHALLFTLAFTVALVPLTLLISYLTAVLVRRQSRFSAFFRSAFFLPVSISFTAAAYMVAALLFPGTGLINVVLRAIGLSDGETTWFTSAGTSFWAVTGLTVWQGQGVAMILLMAGMQSIGEDIFEAAKIDGAGWWRREVSITLPLLKSQLSLCLLLVISGALLTFDQFYVLTKGGPSGSTLTAVMYIYDQSFVGFNLGYGAALSVLLTLIILVVAVFQLRALRSSTPEVRR